MDLSFLPAVNATLNGAAATMLVVGLVKVKRKQLTAHRNCMMSAFALSGLFLVGYVTHKVWKGAHTPFNGEGAAKAVYLFILFTHLVLAMTVPVFAVVLIRLGLKGRDELHRRVARWGWPIWMYVSVTGVVIYFMLYHFNPAGG